MSLDKDYEALASKISKLTGVQFDEKNKSMVKSRIDKRVRELKLDSLNDYITLVNKIGSPEIDELISIMTTHHTYFMREKNQFDYLIKNLPDLIKSKKAKGKNSIRIWSAACSYGEEVYTLSMLLKYHIDLIDPSFKFEIIGTDICQKAVNHASRGIYLWSSLKRVPAMYLSKSWLKGEGDIQHYVKASERIKKQCSFKVVNLIDGSHPIFNDKFDIIFCRNVFIYFNHFQITKIVDKFNQCLTEDGALFVGISETLSDYNKEFKHIGQSIYLKGTEKEENNIIPLSIPTVLKKSIRKLLCVDDSPTVQKIMNKIIQPESGYEVVHCASNGKEAHEYLTKNSVDAVILDLHMPVMDGITYLETYFNKDHPKVLIMSSINRENMDIAQKAIKLGASDYVEKPNVKELDRCVEEITSKLDTILDNSTSFERFEIKEVDHQQDQFNCIISSTLRDLGRVEELISEIGKNAHYFIIPTLETEKDEIERKLMSLPVPTLKVCNAKYLEHHGFNNRNTRVIALSDSYKLLKDEFSKIGSSRFLVEDTGRIDLTELSNDQIELVPFESVVYEIKRVA